jgi:hypothetical protein
MSSNSQSDRQSLQALYATITVDFTQRWVRTDFHDRLSCAGTRPDNADNRREAEDQGYDGADAVWYSLLDHEVLHTLISEWLFDAPSPALRTATAALDRPAPYYLRLEEESIVLSFQRWLNTGECPHALSHYRNELPAWRDAFYEAMAALGDSRYTNQPSQQA